MKKHTQELSKDLANAKFAGIDFHKRTSVVAIGDTHGGLIQQVTSSTKSESFASTSRASLVLNAVIESCRGYEWLGASGGAGHTVHMGDSRSIKLIAVTLPRLTKSTARYSWNFWAKQFLPTCYQPSATERLLRELVRHRAQLVRTSVKHKLRVHANPAKEKQVHLRTIFPLKVDNS
ncbi:MAG: hypothetical protein IPM93_30345 [Candidatus Obscuribacter sp.]|nr:hypothetical protein [Candidatus Obscuribacter sp.]